jgi:hypothetical protein
MQSLLSSGDISCLVCGQFFLLLGSVRYVHPHRLCSAKQAKNEPFGQHTKRRHIGAGLEFRNLPREWQETSPSLSGSGQGRA